MNKKEYEYQKDLEHNCICGCGDRIIWKESFKSNGVPKFIHGHNGKSFRHTEESKNKLRIANLGKKHSEETKSKVKLNHKRPLLGKHHSEETKKKISEKSKAYWVRRGKLTIEEKLKRYTPERNKKISKSKKGQFVSEEHRQRFIAMLSKEEVRKKRAEKLKGRHLSAEHKLKVSIGNKGKIVSEETRLKISKANKGKSSWIKGLSGFKRSEEYKMWYKDNVRKNLILPKKDSSIEVKIQNYLRELGIGFFTHQYMKIEHGYQCDIFIPSLNLVIECDGVYWHKYPTGREIDHIRTKELIEKGFKVLRLWEHEIRAMKYKEELQKIIINQG